MCSLQIRCYSYLRPSDAPLKTLQKDLPVILCHLHIPQTHSSLLFLPSLYHFTSALQSHKFLPRSPELVQPEALATSKAGLSTATRCEAAQPGRRVLTWRAWRFRPKRKKNKEKSERKKTALYRSLFWCITKVHHTGHLAHCLALSCLIRRVSEFLSIYKTTLEIFESWPKCPSFLCGVVTLAGCVGITSFVLSEFIVS